MVAKYHVLCSFLTIPLVAGDGIIGGKAWLATNCGNFGFSS